MTAANTSRHRGTRAPVRGGRMLRRAVATAHIRPNVGTEGAVTRPTLRLPIPERVVRMTEAGLHTLASDPRGWWRRVEHEMASFVEAHLPAGARQVRMRLDADRQEVVIEYQLAPGGSRATSRSAP